MNRGTPEHHRIPWPTLVLIPLLAFLVFSGPRCQRMDGGRPSSSGWQPASPTGTPALALESPRLKSPTPIITPAVIRFRPSHPVSETPSPGLAARDSQPVTSPSIPPTATPTPTPFRTRLPPRSPQPTTPVPHSTTRSPLPESEESTPATQTLTPTVPHSSPSTPAPTQEIMVPSPTVTPSSTPTPTPSLSDRPWPQPPLQTAPEHYWLRRPFDPPAQTWASPDYPYGSNGMGQYMVHHGADFPNPPGTLILAGDAGAVVFAGRDNAVSLGPWPDFYGQAVVIRLDRSYNGQPVYVLYGHVSRWLVEAGEHVKRGQPIAEVGQEGVALGPHLHMEVRLGENAYAATINPEFWLEPLAGHGTLLGRFLAPDGRAWQGAAIRIYRERDGDERFWTEVYTYLPEPGVQPDPLWGENWLLADVPAGTYTLEFVLGRHVRRQSVTVIPGGTHFLTVTLP